MPSAPRLASKAAKVKITFPKLDNPSYIRFLKHTTAVAPGNANDIAQIARPTFDAEYRRQLQKEFGPDEKICRRWLEEMNSKAATKTWDSLRHRFNRKQPGASESAILSEGVERFKLPPVGQHHKAHSSAGQKNERWSLQKYRDFAKKAENLSPDTTFTKQLMDDTFKRAILVATRYGRTNSKSGVTPAEIDKMLKRCLGPESDEYWQGRGGEE